MRALCSLLAGLLIGASAWASSIKSTTIEERARLSDRVVRVSVVASETKVPNDDPRRMITLTTVKVLADYKGSGAPIIEIFQIGGRSGLWEARVPEDARFEVNEHAVLFLRCRDARNPDRCTLVGLKTGKLAVVSDDQLLELPPEGAPQQRRLSEILLQVRRAEPGR